MCEKSVDPGTVQKAIELWDLTGDDHLYVRADLYRIGSGCWQLRLAGLFRYIPHRDKDVRNALFQISCSNLGSIDYSWQVTGQTFEYHRSYCFRDRLETLPQVRLVAGMTDRWIQTYYRPDVCLWIEHGIVRGLDEEWIFMGSYEPLTQQLYGRILQVMQTWHEQQPDPDLKAAAATFYRRLHGFLGQTHREYLDKIHGLIGSATIWKTIGDEILEDSLAIDLIGTQS